MKALLRHQPTKSTNGPEIKSSGNDVKKLLITVLLVACVFALVLSFFSSLAKVNFDGNGADEGGMVEQVLFEGDSLTLPDCKFKRDGYLFTHWTTNLGKGVGTKEYLVGDEYVVLGSVTFYANWRSGRAHV